MKHFFRLKKEYFYIADNASIINHTRDNNLKFIAGVFIGNSKKTDNLEYLIDNNCFLRVFKKECVHYLTYLNVLEKRFKSNIYYYKNGIHVDKSNHIYYIIYSKRPILNNYFQEFKFENFTSLLGKTRSSLKALDSMFSQYGVDL